MNKISFETGDLVALDNIWEVSKKTNIVANACGIGEYEYTLYELKDGTTTIKVPDWIVEKAQPVLSDMKPVTDNDVLKVEYTKGYNKGYYDAYEKIIKMLICDNQINKQIIDITE